MVYVVDRIFLGNEDAQLKQAIQEIQNMGLNIEDQGHPADYVGVSIKKLRDGSYKFTQRALIDTIINNVGINDSRTKPVPAKVSLRPHAFKDEPTFDLDFNPFLPGEKKNWQKNRENGARTTPLRHSGSQFLAEPHFAWS